MHYLDSLPTAVIILIQIFIGVTIILWALLPFAVFGLKSRLDKLNNTAQYILNELERAQAINRGALKSEAEQKHIEPHL